MTVLSTPTPFPTPAIKPAKRSFLAGLWPFSRGRIAHQTFGTLRPWRNGNYLRGRRVFAPLARQIWVILRAADMGPNVQQEKLFHQIEKHFDKLMSRVSKPLLAEYQKVRRLQPAVAWPAVERAEDLSDIIPLGAIWLEQGPGHPFVLSFQSELDKDHEFHVFFRDGKLQNVAFEH